MTSSGLTRTLMGVAATAAVAASLTVSAAPTQALQADGPDYGAPAVGACSTMTLKQSGAQADKSTVVPCSQAHTAKVAGVVMLPGKLDYSSDVKQLYKAMLNRCKPEWNAMLGRTDAVRDSSAYDIVWFFPTRDQRQHGARWMSCSVVIFQAADKMVQLPTNKAPLLPSGKLKDGVHRCLLATTASTITTPCKAKHGWRATGSFVIASKKFPGTTSVNRTARTKCASRTTRGKAYRWTYWTRLNWQVGGDHAVICYTKTTT